MGTALEGGYGGELDTGGGGQCSKTPRSGEGPKVLYSRVGLHEALFRFKNNLTSSAPW